MAWWRWEVFQHFVQMFPPFFERPPRCKEIQHTYNFQDEELLLADWLDDNQVLATQVMCAANMSVLGQRSDVLEKAKYHSSQNCQPITARDFAKHHYIKCLLGYPNAASDAAYLLARACLIGNHIGHFTDCPYSPNVSSWRSLAQEVFWTTKLWRTWPIWNGTWNQRMDWKGRTQHSWQVWIQCLVIINSILKRCAMLINVGGIPHVQTRLSDMMAHCVALISDSTVQRSISMAMRHTEMRVAWEKCALWWGNIRARTMFVPLGGSTL